VCNWALKGHPIKAVGMGGRSNRQVGDPKEVGHIFDHFAIDYEYPNGVHVMSMCRQIANTQGNISEDLVGTKGATHTRSGYYAINGKPVLDKETGRRSTDPYVQEHTDLIASIRSSNPINELKNVAESSLTAIMGRMSTYTGKEVTWDKALNSKEDTMPARLSWDMDLPVAPVAVPGKTPLV
jgi:hypothetical protein